MTEKPFIHDRAIVEPGARVGAGTRVWAFAHVLGGARVGRDCNICDGVFVENDVVIGDRVTLKCGVQLWDGVRLEDDVFVGPNATFTNDLFPRSRQQPETFAQTHVRKRASLGANCTILAGIVIGEHAMVGAGAVVTKDVPPYAIVVGNPARLHGWVPGAPNRRAPRAERKRNKTRAAASGRRRPQA
jgi:acetyltransferase-like isoleucine patch superfamily enzyme